MASVLKFEMSAAAERMFEAQAAPSIQLPKNIADSAFHHAFGDQKIMSWRSRIPNDNQVTRGLGSVTQRFEKNHEGRSTRRNTKPRKSRPTRGSGYDNSEHSTSE